MTGIFDIFLTDEIVRETEPGVVALYGKICIGDYLETFIASLHSWNKAMYQQHWESALGRLVEGETKSALITSYVDPKAATYSMWWPLYRDGDAVYMQNHMLFYDQLQRPFSITNPWESIPERRTATADGRHISEWTTDLPSISKCIAKLRTA
jgi:hypothetical protein